MRAALPPKIAARPVVAMLEPVALRQSVAPAHRKQPDRLASIAFSDDAAERTMRPRHGYFIGRLSA
jgi:hypothetical protein